MSKSKNKFKQTWGTQTEIGRNFGFSAIKVGKLLKEWGLRDENGNPTEKSQNENFCRKVEKKDGTLFYLWHKSKINQMLSNSGHLRKSQLAVEVTQYVNLIKKLNKEYDEKGLKITYLEYQLVVNEIKEKGIINSVNSELQRIKMPLIEE